MVLVIKVSNYTIEPLIVYFLSEQEPKLTQYLMFKIIHKAIISVLMLSVLPISLWIHVWHFPLSKMNLLEVYIMEA